MKIHFKTLITFAYLMRSPKLYYARTKHIGNNEARVFDLQRGFAVLDFSKPFVKTQSMSFTINTIERVSSKKVIIRIGAGTLSCALRRLNTNNHWQELRRLCSIRNQSYLLHRATLSGPVDQERQAAP